MSAPVDPLVNHPRRAGRVRVRSGLPLAGPGRAPWGPHRSVWKMQRASGGWALASLHGPGRLASPAADTHAACTPVSAAGACCRYRKIKDINKGSFGFVVLAENLETREQVAIKFTRVE